MHKKRIIIVEDHIIYWQGLINTLKESFEIVRVFNDGNSVIQFLIKNTEIADVLLLDINLPKKSGLDVLRALKQNNINILSVVLTMHNDKYLAQKAKGLGANAFCNKIISNIELTKVLSSVTADKFITRHIDDFNNSNIKISDGNNVVFTKREKEVISLLVEGKKVKEVSNLLNLSTNTVNTHKKNIYKKANVSSNVELVNFFYENN